jgi:hypothetical protein
MLMSLSEVYLMSVRTIKPNFLGLHPHRHEALISNKVFHHDRVD